MRIVTTRLFLGMGLLVAALPAQPHAPIPEAIRSLARGAASLQDYEGVLWGIGADYRASFTRAGVTFVPALGARAPRAQSLHLRLESFGRGDARIEATAAEPVGSSLQVRYLRAGIEERYDVRPEGVEQSFVFETLPPGDGDLVVAVRIETGMAVADAAANAIRFSAGACGGVRIDHAIGIDAAGNRTDAAMRLAGDVLELRLPAAFVERAALPLVLDPLIGTVVTVSGTDDASTCDVAWDETNDRYLVVWARVLATNDRDIYGQMVDGNNRLVGGPIGIRLLASMVSFRPRVANVNSRDTFVVVWEENKDVMARAVYANSALSNVIQVAVGPNYEENPEIADEVSTSTANDHVLAIWSRRPNNLSNTWTVEATRLTVASTGALTAATRIEISGIANDTVVALSRNGGSSGRHVILWEQLVSGGRQVRGAVVNRDGAILDTVVIAVALQGQARDPVVDGDGTFFVIAHGREESAYPDRYDVVCRGWRFNATTATLGSATGEVPVAAVANSDDVPSGVVLLADSALVGFTSRSTAGVASVDLTNCMPCEKGFYLEGGARLSGAPQFARRAVAAPEALIVWIEGTTTSSIGDVLSQRFRAETGVITNLGGGCGGGTFVTSCATVGNADFTLRVQGAPVSATTYLVLATRRIDLPCGACRIVPDPFEGLVFSPGLTNASGNALAMAPIPNTARLVGASFTAQWFVAGTGCVGFGLSNALQVQIQ